MSKLLSKFLESPQRPEGTLSLYELQGLLFAVACSPELVNPSEWMPLICDEQHANYASMEEAKSVLGALMDLYNDINDQVFDGEVAFPSGVGLQQPALDNVGEAAPLGQWARGFTLGHNWLIELWEHYIPDELDDELGSSVMVLSFFSAQELAEAYYREIANSSTTLEEFAETVLGLFEDAMNSYAHLSCSIRTALAEQDLPEAPYVRLERAGRNDPCPCGSGKKYKKCCLQ